MSASIVLRLRCGCTSTVDPEGAVIACPLHHETRVVSVSAPTPRIRGTASGPHVTTVDLEPFTGTFNA